MQKCKVHKRTVSSLSTENTECGLLLFKWDARTHKAWKSVTCKNCLRKKRNAKT